MLGSQDLIFTLQVVVVVLLGLPLVVILNFIIRTCVILIAKQYGVWDPRIDYLWPRLPWRPFWRAISWISRWWQRSFGMRRSTARFKGVLSSLAMLYKPGTVLIGSARLWFGACTQAIGIKEVKRHLFFMADTGVGKTTFLTTMVALWDRSAPIWILDPKGQIYKAIGWYLKLMGRRVMVFDPTGITGQPSIKINFFDFVTYASKNGVDRAGAIFTKWAQDAIQGGPNTDPVWIKTPQMAYEALCHYVNGLPPEQRNMLMLRDLAVRGFWWESDDPAEAKLIMWTVLSQDETGPREMRTGATQMLTAPEKQRASFDISLVNATAWIDQAQTRPLLTETTGEPWAVKGTNDCFMAIAAISEIKGSLQTMFRMLISTSLYAHEIVPNEPGKPSTLFVVDEFPSLDHVVEVKRALPLMRGYNVTFFGAAQTLEQLKDVYPKSWGGFISGSDATFWLGINHDETAEFLSKKLGKRHYVRKEPIEGTRRWWRGFRRRKRKTYEEHTLMTPDQVQLYTSGNRMIVTLFGDQPMLAQMMPYFDWLRVDMYDADPDYGDKPGREVGRKIIKKAVIGVEKARKEIDRRFGRGMPEEHARAILGGIVGPFTAIELSSRAALAEQTFPKELVATALNTLRPLAIQGAA
ncbi:MAG: type IV secretory system conjugative DNA transfer family protein [Pseudomonadota bacterium]